jgi:hypothetical protein
MQTERTSVVRAHRNHYWHIVGIKLEAMLQCIFWYDFRSTQQGLAAEAEGVTGLSTISGVWADCAVLDTYQMRAFGCFHGKPLCRVPPFFVPWRSLVVNREQMENASTLNLCTTSNPNFKNICRPRK